MKNHLSYRVLLFLLLFCGIAEAKVNSYMGVSANVGEWSMLPVESAYTPSLGAAGGVGFVYPLRIRRTGKFSLDTWRIC